MENSKKDGIMEEDVHSGFRPGRMIRAAAAASVLAALCLAAAPQAAEASAGPGTQSVHAPQPRQQTLQQAIEQSRFETSVQNVLTDLEQEPFFPEDEGKPRLFNVPEKQKTKAYCLEVLKTFPGDVKHLPASLKNRAFYLEATKAGCGIAFFLPKKDLDFQICAEAVKRGFLEVQDVPAGLLTLDMCFDAVRLKGTALAYVPEKMKTPELCLEAVRNWGQALYWVPEKEKTPLICAEALASKHPADEAMLMKHVPARMQAEALRLAAQIRMKRPDPGPASAGSVPAVAPARRAAP